MQNSFTSKAQCFTLAVFFIFIAGVKSHAGSIILGSQGEHLYNYLCLTDALIQGKDETIASSIMGLIKKTPELPVYQDGVTILISRKNYSVALQVAKKGLEVYPEDPVLTKLYASLLIELGNIEDATTLLKVYLAKVPEDVEAKQELLKIYISQEKEAEAQVLLKEIEGKDESPMVAYFRCTLLVTTEKYDLAKKELLKLIKEYPNFVEACLELAYVYESEKNIDEAVAWYTKALDISKDNTGIRLHIVSLLVSQKKLSKAEKIIDRSSSPASFKLEAAIIFSDSGYYDAAKKLIKEAKVAGCDKATAAKYLSSIAFKETQDPLQALAPLEAIRESDPDYLSIVMLKVELLINAQQFQKASDLASRARKKYPEDSRVWSTEAFSLFKQGKASEAIELLFKARKLHPKSEEVLLALGSIQDESGQTAQALATMEYLLTLNPNNSRALNYIGYTLATEKRDLDRAVTLLTIALQESPNSEYIIDSLAWAYYQKGAYSDAWTAIKKCLELAQTDVAVLEHYGDIALAMGEKDKAKEAYEKVLKLNPKNASKISEKLKKLTK